jgi:hypothetical protein
MHSWIIYGASLCTIVAGLAFFFVTLFQCSPISFYWDKDQSGRCLDINIIMALAFLYSAFSVITDFTFAILPAFVIWNLQLQIRAKVALIVLVTMGCLLVLHLGKRLPEGNRSRLCLLIPLLEPAPLLL